MKKLFIIIIAALVTVSMVLQFPAAGTFADDVVTNGGENAAEPGTDAGTSGEGKTGTEPESATDAADYYTVRDGVVYYDINQLGRFKERTFNQVVERLNAAQHTDYSYWQNREKWYEHMPSLAVPYSEGVLAAETVEIMHDMIDFWRWMAGVDQLYYPSEIIPELQKAALVRNFDVKPDDMDSRLWKEGMEVKHILQAMDFDPDQAINGWLNEGYSHADESFTDDNLSHRYAILGRNVVDADFGYAGSIALARIAVNSTDMGAELFTAFPSPGDFPSWFITLKREGYTGELKDVNVSAWSLDFNDQITGIPDSEKVTVTVTDMNTGNSYVCTEVNGKLKVNGKILAFAQPDEDGALHYQHSYKVEISGLAEKIRDEKNAESGFGRPVVVQYTVNFHASAIEVRDDDLVIGKGETVNLGITDASAPASTVTVVSADPKVATVDDAGNVTGKAFGETVITVSNEAGAAISVKVKVGFKDVINPARSTYKTIYWGAECGIISGFNDATFRPEADCTRGQFAIMLWRMAGKPAAEGEPRAFSDVSASMPYYKAVNWASAGGIVNGFNDGSFGPEDPLTRAQIVIMVWRYLDRAESESEDSFPDVPRGNTTYRAVQWASENGIVRGYADGTFRPADNCTREQIITILYRAVREGFMEVR